MSETPYRICWRATDKLHACMAPDVATLCTVHCINIRILCDIQRTVQELLGSHRQATSSRQTQPFTPPSWRMPTSTAAVCTCQPAMTQSFAVLCCLLSRYSNHGSVWSAVLVLPRLHQDRRITQTCIPLDLLYPCMLCSAGHTYAIRCHHASFFVVSRSISSSML